MSENRLNLNFKLNTKEERVKFTHEYLDSIPFTPTEAELDTIAKYILWGKTSETGLNGRQEGLELETKHHTWDKKRFESLDALIESPNFSESLLLKPTDPPTKIPKEAFSRSLARAKASAPILTTLELLWRRIDETELLLNLYDLLHEKRMKPPRPQLLRRVPSQTITYLEEKAKTLPSYIYLRLKHELVELRREQYALKDEYAPTLQKLSTFSYNPIEPTLFGEDITVFPIGIPSDNIILYSKIFNSERYPIPDDFSEEDLRALSTLLWKPAPQKEGRFFDFRDVNHLYKLYSMWEDLTNEDFSYDSTLPYFLRAASMYRTLAALDPIHSDILDLKIQKKENQVIAEIINKKYSKSYRPNYISTLYCKKCLGEIAKAAARHREILENCFFPENFKRCKDCGDVLLLDELNFVKRHRSSDGFSPRCKKCEKILRDSKKEN